MAKNDASTRYSELDQINADNVGDLHVTMTFSTDVLRGHEAAPLVVNETMYVVAPCPNDLYALDLSKPGAPINGNTSRSRRRRRRESLAAT